MEGRLLRFLVPTRNQRSSFDDRGQFSATVTHCSHTRPHRLPTVRQVTEALLCPIGQVWVRVRSACTQLFKAPQIALDTFYSCSELLLSRTRGTLVLIVFLSRKEPGKRWMYSTPLVRQCNELWCLLKSKWRIAEGGGLSFAGRPCSIWLHNMHLEFSLILNVPSTNLLLQNIGQ